MPFNLFQLRCNLLVAFLKDSHIIDCQIEATKAMGVSSEHTLQIK